MSQNSFRPLRVGDVLAVALPRLLPSGREQQGVRPVVVVAIPERPRYPMLVIAPLTSNVGPWAHGNALYPVIGAGQGGLKVRSTVLTDHLRSLDASRSYTQVGSLTDAEYQPIQAALTSLFGLESKRA